MVRAKLREIVKWMLENEIETRNDDELLVALVDARINPSVEVMSYAQVMKYRYRLGLPSVESITRCRRELQTEYPHLKGYDWVTRRRIRKEKETREYYRGKKDHKGAQHGKK